MVSVNPRRRVAKAFTLPELLVAVVILGILASLGLPTFLSTLRIQRLRSGASAMAAQLRTAQGAARQFNRSCTIALVGLSIQEPASALPEDCGPPPLSAVDLRSESQDSRIQVSDGSGSSYSFTSGGLLQGSSRTVLLSTSGSTTQICLNVQAPGGLVRIGSATGSSANCIYPSG